MILLVDAGNSRVKWACLQRAEIQAGEAFPSDPKMLAGQLRSRWAGLAKPRAIYLSNVAGAEWERTFVDWARAVWDSEIRVLHAEADAYGIVNGYEKPETLGVDRWVGLIGAKAIVGLPVCLIDCGTAVTVDLVDAQGRHRGGLIAPGLTLMKDSLQRGTRGVAAGVGASGVFWGRNTAEGLENGAREMILGLIGRSAHAARSTLGELPTLVLTGGDAKRLAVMLEIPHRLAPDLVLRGLAAVAQQGLQPCSADSPTEGSEARVE